MIAAGRQTREILSLAVPAFLALVAEPLFLLADTAIVGHLGTSSLAGLGVASAILLTAANLFVFLAYGTTSIVARQVGAGAPSMAISSGLDGAWLALGLGVVVAVVVGVYAEPLSAVFGASASVLSQATIYLRISAVGIPAMLVVLATTGALRGLQDTRTPLIVAVSGFSANLLLNLVLVLGFGWGIAGSAWGTVVAQSGMALALIAIVVRRAHATKASMKFAPLRVLRAAGTGLPLLIRTVALRAVLLMTTWVAAQLGDVALAAYQVTATMWTFQTFSLDALAIAAQALTGKALGAGDPAAARSSTTVMLRWGALGGLILGALLIATHQVLPLMFTPDVRVQAAISAALIVVGLSGWLSGLVFVADGVLIGAGDGRWLAKAMIFNALLYLPVLAVVYANVPNLIVLGDPTALAALWGAFIVFMVIRGALMWVRVRSDDWLVVGAVR